MGIIGCILGLYWDNGNENGNYYLGFRASILVQNYLPTSKVIWNIKRKMKWRAGLT